MQHLRGREGRRDHSASGVVENAYVTLRILTPRLNGLCEVGDAFVFFDRTRARDIASAGQDEVNQAFATKYGTQQPLESMQNVHRGELSGFLAFSLAECRTGANFVLILTVVQHTTPRRQRCIRKTRTSDAYAPERLLPALPGTSQGPWTTKGPYSSSRVWDPHGTP